MNCPKCGKPIVPGAAFCGNCGQPVGLNPYQNPYLANQVQQVQPRTTKNEALAAALSFLILGVGHFYLGRWIRGALWLVGGFFTYFLLAVILEITNIADYGSVIRFIAPAIAILSAVDAYTQAKKINSSKV